MGKPMGVRRGGLGQTAPTGWIAYNYLTQVITWGSSATGATIYINGLVFANGASGTASASQVRLGSPYKFLLIADTGETLASLDIDINGAVSYTSTASPGETVDDGGNVQGIVPLWSWFSESTVLFGEEIPNVALAAGGVVALMLFLRR